MEPITLAGLKSIGLPNSPPEPETPDSNLAYLHPLIRLSKSIAEQRFRIGLAPASAAARRQAHRFVPEPRKHTTLFRIVNATYGVFLVFFADRSGRRPSAAQGPLRAPGLARCDAGTRDGFRSRMGRIPPHHDAPMARSRARRTVDLRANGRRLPCGNRAGGQSWKKPGV